MSHQSEWDWRPHVRFEVSYCWCGCCLNIALIVTCSCLNNSALVLIESSLLYYNQPKRYSNQKELSSKRVATSNQYQTGKVFPILTIDPKDICGSLKLVLNKFAAATRFANCSREKKKLLFRVIILLLICRPKDEVVCPAQCHWKREYTGSIGPSYWSCWWGFDLWPSGKSFEKKLQKREKLKCKSLKF